MNWANDKEQGMSGKYSILSVDQWSMKMGDHDELGTCDTFEEAKDVADFHAAHDYNTYVYDPNGDFVYQGIPQQKS